MIGKPNIHKEYVHICVMNLRGNIDKIGFGLATASIVSSIYAYTLDEHLGLFIGLWASAIMLGSKRIHDWMNE
jgi:hypothetical protein